MSDWPVKYVPDDDRTNAQASAPTWTKQRCFDGGNLVAAALIADKNFARSYHRIVKSYYRIHDDRLLEYAGAVQHVYQNPDTSAFNEHDFANVHRVAWLNVARTLARLVALSPFKDPSHSLNYWADPPQGGTARAVDWPTGRNAYLFFEIPNARGYYAFSSTDFDLLETVPMGEVKDANGLT